MSKNKTLITILFIVLLLLTLSFAGCITEDEPNEPKKSLSIQNKIDNPSVLPDWNDGDYHEYYKTTDFVNEFQIKYPDLVNVFSIGNSVLGKEIWCIRITNEKNNEAKFSCLIDGGIHGNEWESTEACLYLTEYLLINYDYNKTVGDILNTSEIYIVPMLNPDGRQNDERWNENGIDLNRNFNSHFGRLKSQNLRLGKLFGRIKIPIIEFPRLDRRYINCGRRAFSEPETSALRNFANSFNAKDFSFYVNCHTAQHYISTICNVNYKPEFTVTNHERTVFNSVLDWVGENTEYPPLYGEQYQHAGFGSAQDWFFKKFHIVSFSFEILSLDYEPGYYGGGPHDRLVHWMKTTLPVFLYLLVNIENLHNWKTPDIEPLLPEGVPPEPLK